MNKKELVEAIAKKTGLKQNQAAAAVAAFTDAVAAELKKKDGKVQLVGFGTFSIAERKARKGRNPKTGLVEIVELPGHPFFIGVQFHPEYKSTPEEPQPIFKAFVAAAIKRAEATTE